MSTRQRFHRRQRDLVKASLVRTDERPPKRPFVGYNGHR